MKPFVRSAYNYDADEASLVSGLKCEDRSLAVQSQANDADINVIVKRFGLTGLAPVVPRPPSYGDFDSVSDYGEALRLIQAADKSFMRLPADVRSRFDNDAARFVDFCSDEDNLEEMRKMGLAVPAVVVAEAAKPTP